MKIPKLDLLISTIIFIISLLFTLELFMSPGRPANFDSNFHITNIAQFSKIIQTGEVPVIWMNNFANYGLPMGIFAHQLTNYLGGIINIFLQNPTLSYNILVFIGILLTNLFLYIFLRLYFKSWSSFIGVFVFCFTPYHIFNIYVRGAMPEIFSGIFVPLILTSLYLIIVRKKVYGYFLLSIFIFILTLNHPMMLIVYSLIFLPYLIYLIYASGFKNLEKFRLFVISGLFMVLGLLMASYYIVPLNFEIKYFYYGLIKDHIDKGSFLNLTSLVDPRWYYFTKNEVYPRGHVVIFGLLESLILSLGFVIVFFNKLFKKHKNWGFLYFCIIEATIIIFFNLQISFPLFKNISVLNNIQFPWRFLSDLIFIPPLVIAFLYNFYPKKVFIFVIIFIVAILSFPQLYGKNFTIFNSANYYFSTENAHSVLMNTIWTGKSEEYPNKLPQAMIIEGKGSLTNSHILNSSRSYYVNAENKIKIVDHTFYFPGWVVYIDGLKTNIEFQNPDYRGVITFYVPQGKHNIKLVFEDTKIRLLGKIMTLCFVILFGILFILRRKLKKFLFNS